MPYYQRQGQIPHKRHTQFRDATGKLRFEELFSTRGFEGPYALLYHETYPVEIDEITDGGRIDFEEWKIDTQQNRCMFTSDLDSSGDILTSRRALVYNDDVTIGIANPDRSTSDFFRNGLCDEMLMVQHGSGRMQSPYGVIDYEDGDIFIIPRGTTYSWHPDAGVAHRVIFMESRTPIVPPRKYFVTGGQLAEHSPFCERDFKTPVLPPPTIKRGAYRIVTKMDKELTVYTVPNHPYDVVGWDGSLYPYAMNIRDFEPLTRRIHAMPDEQQAFETGGAAVCCFVPRMADYHPDAIPSPPLHSNIDCDEVLFNLGGPMLGWGKGGLMTLHPRGLFHAAKIYEESIGMKEFEGSALMIDCFKPLKLTNFAEKCADPDYHMAWKKDRS